MNEAPRRPRYVPSRYSWWEGESADALPWTIREARVEDYYAARALGIRCPYRKWLRWVGYTGYSVWLVCRNTRNPFACLVTRHTPSLHTVLQFATHPSFDTGTNIAGLCRLAQSEIPEAPMEWKMSLSDTDRLSKLRGAEWKVVTYDADDDTCVARRDALLVGRGSPSPGAPSRVGDQRE